MSKQPYWFPAKSYGWGWGLPVTWQGWVVTVAYFALLLGGIPLIEPARNAAIYAAYAVALSAVMIGICWLKGEPPSWRWGKR
jgi:hypothetical protein